MQVLASTTLAWGLVLLKLWTAAHSSYVAPPTMKTTTSWGLQSSLPRKLFPSIINHQLSDNKSTIDVVTKTNKANDNDNLVPYKLTITNNNSNNNINNNNNNNKLMMSYLSLIWLWPRYGKLPSFNLPFISWSIKSTRIGRCCV